MYFSEKVVGARRYRVAAQAVWDAKAGRAYSRQAVLGPAGLPPKVELSETRTVGRQRVGDVGAVPLFHRTYAGNASDHRVLEDCLVGLGLLHDALDAGEGRERPAERTLVRDGGSWGEQMELNLDVAGYYTITSLPLGTKAAEEALTHAATRGAMKSLTGKLRDVRAARLRTSVGELDRTLVVVESDELLEGQKRGIAAALRKARGELTKLERLVAGGRIRREALERRITKTLRREHLASFVIATVGGSDDAPTLQWAVDADKRRELERTRLGKRVLCTDRHSWTTERLVTALRGQWNVEEIFRRSKKGGVVPWGPSHQWADASLRVHTFATVLGLMLVSLARLVLGTSKSARLMMRTLAEIEATQVRTTAGGMGRRPTWLLAPDITPWQQRAIKTFELGRWMPELLSARPARRKRPENHAVA